MTRKKGTQKTGGRTKGVPNKVTTDLRTWIHDLLNSNRQQIDKDIKQLEPQQRVMLFEKLLSYAIPKMQSVEAKIDIEQLTDEQINLIINEITKDLDDE
ncbi:MAG: hypothetical protein LBJ63_08110 [Prevotellaceae bacterium]|jgi:hypothetical protein|nr:hypothetical protein [Prevotellaceae bacterium]